MPSNMAFHDLTPNKSAPKSAKALLGLGSKFICTPKYTTGSISASYKRLERDMHLRVFFACGNELDPSPERDKSKLYVNSDWRPEFGDIPFWVDQRLSFMSAYNGYSKRNNPLQTSSHSKHDSLKCWQNGVTSSFQMQIRVLDPVQYCLSNMLKIA